MRTTLVGCTLVLLAAFVLGEDISMHDDSSDWDPGVYHLIGGKYYFVDRWEEQIETARSYCRRVGMIPVTFEDPAKKPLLDEYFNNLGYGFYDFWTNGVKRGGSSQYIWEPSGVPFDETQWAAGQPVYADDTRDVCIRYSSESGFTDWVCDASYPNWSHILCQEP